MWHRIIHPDLFSGNFADLSDFYHFTCTIQEAPGVQDAAGEEILTYVDKAGHIGLPCTLGPAGGKEIKAPNMTYVVASHTISLAGDYPLVKEKMQAVIGGVKFDILLVTHDSQSKTTHLDCQIVS